MVKYLNFGFEFDFQARYLGLDSLHKSNVVLISAPLATIAFCRVASSARCLLGILADQTVAGQLVFAGWALIVAGQLVGHLSLIAVQWLTV